MVSAAAAARVILDAQRGGRQIAPFSDDDPSFDLIRANAAAVEIVRLRTARGERVAGHKLGFTNRRIWDEYGVHAPIWGPVWDTTVAPLDVPCGVGALMEPKIEPEIVFRFARPPSPDMDAEALLSCVSHVALGFELVQSVYPGWRFRAPDTVAAFALHGALRCGPFVGIAPAERLDWAARLGSFRLTLLCDGTVADEGQGAAVLDTGPVAALAHLAGVLATIPGSPPVAEGHVFTTGTLTRALPVAPGETWEAVPHGLPLDPIRLRLD
jgi:2-oxo-3-hexenedioate decarboxylase